MQNIGDQETVFESGAYEYIDTKVVINNVTYTRADIQYLRIIGDLYSNNTLSFGSACSRQLKLTLTQGNNVIPKQAKIEVFQRVVDDPEDLPSWINKGTFFIDTRETIDNTDRINIVAYDSMLKAEADYYATQAEITSLDVEGTSPYTDITVTRSTADDVDTTYIAPYAWKNGATILYTDSETPAVGDSIYYDPEGYAYGTILAISDPTFNSRTMALVAEDIADIICSGLDSRCSFESYSFTADDMEMLNGSYSQREVLGIIASAHGGNFIITDNDELLLIREDGSATEDFTIDNSLATKMDIGRPLDAVTGVELNVNDAIYSSGTDSGYVVSITCPVGSQTMADALLTQLTGLVYNPYEGNVRISPACEMGDRFEYDNRLYILAHCDFMHNNTGYQDVSAPTDGEIEHEYPYMSSRTRAMNRTISKKLDQEGGDEHEFAWRINKKGAHLYSDDKEVLKINDTDAVFSGIIHADGGVFNGSGLQSTQGEINSLRSQSVDSDKVISENMECKELKITGNGNPDNDRFGLYFLVSRLFDKDTGTSTQVTRTFTYSPACSLSGEYLNIGVSVVANSAVPSITTVTATVRCTVIYADTGTPDYFTATLTGTIPAGETTAFFYATPVVMYSSCTLSSSEITYPSTGTSSKTYDIPSVSTFLAIRDSQGIIPAFPNSMDLGTSGLYWKDVNAVNFNHISDKRCKEEIKGLTKAYDKVFDKLKPVTYKVINSDGSIHIGFIAQDVMEAFKSANIDVDSMGIVQQGDILSLRYTEFIAMNTLQIQKLKSRVAELEERLDKLEKEK